MTLETARSEHRGVSFWPWTGLLRYATGGERRQRRKGQRV